MKITKIDNTCLELATLYNSELIETTKIIDESLSFLEEESFRYGVDDYGELDACTDRLQEADDRLLKAKNVLVKSIGGDDSGEQLAILNFYIELATDLSNEDYESAENNKNSILFCLNR